MARLQRFNIPGEPQHVIIRGNNREPIFYSDSDYHCYLNTLGSAMQKYPCELHAYVLMTNHVHMLVSPLEENSLSKVIQSLGRVYVQFFNYKYRRTGTLWEGRYKATLIDSDLYALICSRYIELNPVRAEMVAHPGEYPWSSYRSNALGVENELLVPHETYQSLGQTEQARQGAYRALFDTHIPPAAIEQIREMTNKAWVLGSEQYKSRVRRQLDRATGPKDRGGDRRSKNYQHMKKINRV